MSVEFWYRLGSYYLGIISVLALLFALIESSRQFEHSKKWQPIIAAVGFFLIIVAILVKTVLLDSENLTVLLAVCQIIGFLGVSIGFHANKPAESLASSDIVANKNNQPIPEDNQFDWMSLLSNPITAKPTQVGLKDKTQETVQVTEETSQPEQPKTAKSTKKEAIVDLSYLAERRKKPTPKPIKESRDQILNDLFPIEKPGKSKKSAIFPLALGSAQLFSVAPFITLVIITSIILGLIPRRLIRGNTPLLFGFCILLIVWMSRVIIDPNNLSDNLSLTIQAIETIGFAFIGFGSWVKIKGKASHHFAAMLCSTTLGLMVITTTLGYYYVTQSDTLQLLLYFCTGVLIVVIPVIHATIFDHLPERQNQAKV